ncbi:MAG: hypothetical protein SGJ10_07765 [Bacteroidota bacterium]|nr:hypothetical protein [Bacteroidota bacterium]
MQCNVGDIVLKAVSQIFSEYQMPTNEMQADTLIYGERGGINSLALVRLIVDLEEMIEMELDVSITIADEKVLSMKHSPFATVGSLTEFVDGLVQAN